ncbi:MAG: hypothetical protein HYR56_02695 [Acidobacteria bacterium]|nr:hypothetical protein [Acidobacteriota bacterium]MBI3425537.1 hypothetical protein [Acidobacteriota bacterium]
MPIACPQVQLVQQPDYSILIAESSGFPAAAREKLRGIAQLRFAELGRAELLRALRSADVLWVRLRNHIDAEVMAAAPQLKLIATPTTGLTHIDLAEAERRGIRVLSLYGETDFLKEVRATAEHTIGLMLALLRHTTAAYEQVRQGEWNRDRYRGSELYGKTAGVIGYGRLGRIVARYLRAFEMRVLACDPNVDPATVEDGVEMTSLREVLRQSDLVSVHVNLCEQTQGFFGAMEFGAMKPGACFINTSRGELLDEQALLQALNAGRVRGAALDVLSHEDATGMEHHPLIRYAQTHHNLLITPHLGGCTNESMEKTEIFLAEKLAQTLADWKATSCAE